MAEENASSVWEAWLTEQSVGHGSGAEGQQDPPPQHSGDSWASYNPEEMSLFPQGRFSTSQISSSLWLAKLSCPLVNTHAYTHSGLLPRGTCNSDGWADSHERAVCWVFPKQCSENRWPPGFTGALLAPSGLKEGSVNWIPPICNRQWCFFIIHPWGRPLLSPVSSEIHQSHASVFVSLCLT